MRQISHDSEIRHISKRTLRATAIVMLIFHDLDNVTHKALHIRYRFSKYRNIFLLAGFEKLVFIDILENNIGLSIRMLCETNIEMFQVNITLFKQDQIVSVNNVVLQRL